MEVLHLILAVATLLVAAGALLATVTDWFKRKVPVSFGFLVNGKMVSELSLSTGDPAKLIPLRFHNRAKTTFTGVVIVIRFMRPLTLSATDRALRSLPVPGKTNHGPPEHGNYYQITYSDLQMVGQDKLDFQVELDTTNKAPGAYDVLVTVYSTQQQHYKYCKSKLTIRMS